MCDERVCVCACVCVSVSVCVCVCVSVCVTSERKKAKREKIIATELTPQAPTSGVVLVVLVNDTVLANLTLRAAEALQLNASDVIVVRLQPGRAQAHTRAVVVVEGVVSV